MGSCDAAVNVSVQNITFSVEIPDGTTDER